MNDKPANTNAWDVLDAAIGRMIRRLATRRDVACIQFGVAGFLAAILTLVAADHTLGRGLPSWLTWPATLVLSIMFLVIEGLLILRAGNRRWNAAYAALQIERFLGGAQNAIINAVLLRNGASSASAALAVADAAAAECERAPAEPRPTANEPERRPLIALSAAVLAWLVFTFVTPKSVTQSLARLAGADLPAPTMTQLIWISPGFDEGVYAGEPLLIRVRQSGRVVEHVECAVAPLTATGRADTAPVPMSRESGSSNGWCCLLAANETVADFRFTCTSGDARIDRVIRVRPRPGLQRYRVTIRPPAYTGLPERGTEDPEISAPAGSEIEIAVTANVDIRNPVLVFSARDESRSRMTVSAADARTAAVRFRPEHSGRYRVLFSDAWGRAVSDPPSHAIHLIEDQPPSVRITSPDESQRLPDGVDLSVVPDAIAEATDDYGISKTEFVIALEDGRTVTLPVIPLSATNSTRTILAQVRIADAPIAPGTTARAWFEAFDNRVLPDETFDPQRGRSETILLRRPAPPKPAKPDSSNPATGATASDQSETGSDKSAPGAGGGPPDQSSKSEAADDSNAHDRQQSTANEADQETGDPVADFMWKHARELKQLERRLADNILEKVSQSESEGLNKRDSKDNHEPANQGQEMPSDALSDSDSPPAPDASGADRPNRSGSRTDDRGDSRNETLKGDQPTSSETVETTDKPPTTDSRGNQNDSTHRDDSSQRTDSNANSDSMKERPTSNPGDESPTTGGVQDSSNDQNKSDVGERESEMHGGEREGASDDKKSTTRDSEIGDSAVSEGQRESPRHRPDGPIKQDSSKPGSNESIEKSDEDRSRGRDRQSDAGMEVAQPQASPENADQPTPTGKSNDQTENGGSTESTESGKPPSGEEPSNEPAQSNSQTESENQSRDGRSRSGQTPGQGLDGNLPKLGRGEATNVSPASQPSELPTIESEEHVMSRAAKIRTEGRPEFADALDCLLRVGGVTPELANDLGWTETQMDNFNREFRRLANSGLYVRPESDPQNVPVDSDKGPDSIQPGAGGDAFYRYNSMKDRQSDKLKSIAPPADQRISSDLNQVLREYYRSMSSRETSKNAP